jgi:hypothetical protein
MRGISVENAGMRHGRNTRDGARYLSGNELNGRARKTRNTLKRRVFTMLRMPHGRREARIGWAQSAHPAADETKFET